MSKRYYSYVTKIFIITIFLTISSWSDGIASHAQGYNEPIQNADFNEVMYESKLNTVRIVVDGAKYGFYGGSGWVVKPGYILTNAHVVKRPDFDVKTISVEFQGAATGKAMRIETTLEAIDEINDIALLKYSVNMRTKWIKGFTLAEENPLPGSSLLSVGNPVSEAVNGQKTIKYGYTVLDFAYTEGTYIGKRKSLWLIPVQAVLDSDAIAMFSEKGNSGGPVIDTKGHIVGMMRGFVDYSIPRTSLSVPLQDIKNFIDSNVPNMKTYALGTTKKETAK